MEPIAYLIIDESCKTLSFDIARNPDAQQIPLYSIDQLVEGGWMRCAEGQRTTQYCGQTIKDEALQRHALEELKAENERLRGEVERLRTDGASAIRWAPSSAYWSDVLVELFGPDAREGIDVLERRWRRERERAEQLEEALRGWWKGRRPVGWTEDQHRSCPHVNLATDAEKALADAMLRAREAGND